MGQEGLVGTVGQVNYVRSHDGSGRPSVYLVWLGGLLCEKHLVVLLHLTGPEDLITYIYE